MSPVSQSRKYVVIISCLVLIIITAILLISRNRDNYNRKNSAILAAGFIRDIGFPRVKGVDVPVGYTFSSAYVINNTCIDCVVSSFKEALENNGWDIKVRKMDEFLMSIFKNYKDSLSNTTQNPDKQRSLPPGINQKAADYIANNNEETIRRDIGKVTPTVIEGRRRKDGMKCMISVAGTAEGKKSMITIQLSPN